MLSYAIELNVNTDWTLYFSRISNELVSPQSRKLSDEELQSEDDLSDLYVGEFASKSFLIEDKLTPEKVHAFKNKIDDASLVLSKYDLENLGEDALNSLKTTLDSFRFVANAPLDAHHYQAEIDSLRQQLDILQRAKELKDAGTQVSLFTQKFNSVFLNSQIWKCEEESLFCVFFIIIEG